ncbi:DUF559 domain-containing protein [Leucobacter weissii]|uniref:DUF559 domain-containing protein n=1 Tax=Leucobacter weissii TaxID=1983706 RepID=A0A939SD63_9MICO|nr:DUF559 domain-containing protein [Leucobacter weissii]MBO1903115.1 DUF559 domain-containing protein [Leucobacter weissii]
MDLSTALHRSGGVARSAALSETGVRRADIERALRTGAVIRPRRGWLALAEADPELIGAARYSVVLSCVTQARRLGLWVLEEPLRHVAARTPTSRAEAEGCVIHWGAPTVPRAPWTLEDPLENLLGYAAACLSYEAARAVWESALNKRLITLDRLRSLPYRGRARRLAFETSPFSDSGLETLVLSRLRWLRVRVIPQAWVHGHRVDFLIGERLILQIDGRDHVGRRRTSDNRHDSSLALNGYYVIRVGYEQVVDDWPAVQHEVMTAIAQGRHLVRRTCASGGVRSSG